MIVAKPATQSSMIGRPFLTWSLPFIPNFAVHPPATTRTFLNVPAATNELASITACDGAAQNPLVSDPLAFTKPANSAIDLAKLPPPRWFMSPHASSEHSITYSISSGLMSCFAITCNAERTPDALTTKFSNITWAFKLGSISWALLTHPITLPSLINGSACWFLIASSIADWSAPSFNLSTNSSLISGWSAIFCFIALLNSCSSKTRSKTSTILIRPMNSSCGIISPYLPCLSAFGILWFVHGISISAKTSGLALPM